ncbi:helix-turn-helix transcriptional regulator [Geminocystis sp. NIES-3708]|uniref:helix-turn-helix domain-containing protein n=1 Tax=Geminocystis sp. NIES-3708 TaxID=1615909 RepID=UPI00130D8B68|nr:helix-turn-helix domain-containing protein [Geminocystis sp. NIES-3708]
MPNTLEKDFSGIQTRSDIGLQLIQSAMMINAFLIKPKFTLAEFKNLIHNTKKNVELNLIENNFINIKNVFDILEGISRIFPEIKFPEFKERNPTFIKPVHYSYVKKEIDINPSSPQTLDILDGIIKIKLWTDKEDEKEFERRKKYPHADDKGILKINQYDYELVKFDYKDVKILLAIMSEAYYQSNDFYISLNKILNVIGEGSDKNVFENGILVPMAERRKDVEKRIEKFKFIRYIWRHYKGKEPYGNYIEGLGQLKSIKSNIINIGNIVNFDNDTFIKIGLPDWYHFNKNTLRQNTYLPLKLLQLNVKKYPLSFAIGHRICIHFRINKKNFTNSIDSDNSLNFKLKTILDDVLNTDELKLALTNHDKGFKLKIIILNAIDKLKTQLKWQIQWQGLEEKISFNDFYHKTSFIVTLDPELESEIIGQNTSITVPSEVIESIPQNYELSSDDIKLLRKNLKMTQIALAEAINCDQTTVSKLENGKIPVSPVIYNKLKSKYKPQILALKDKKS